MTQSARKLDIERQVLELVYDPTKYDEIIQEDSPDFRIVRAGKAFGVEVTELFRDESDARLMKVEDYMSNLWAGEKHIHRADQKRLNVVKVTVSDPDGKVKATDVVGILRESSTMTQHYDALAELIERKNAAFANYKTDFTHTNLLIADHFDGNSTVSGEWSTGDLFTPRLREAVRVTPFRSIIVIGHVGYDDSKWIPLDLMWLWEAFMLYVDAAFKTSGAIDALEEQDLSVLFVDAMIAAGEPARLRMEGGELFAAAGGFSIAYGVEGIKIHDLADWDIERPQDRPTLLGKADEELIAEIATKFTELRETGILMTQYAMPVRSLSALSTPLHTDYHLEAVIPAETPEPKA